jgi:hypothetical protein
MLLLSLFLGCEGGSNTSSIEDQNNNQVTIDTQIENNESTDNNIGESNNSIVDDSDNEITTNSDGEQNNTIIDNNSTTDTDINVDDNNSNDSTNNNNNSSDHIIEITKDGKAQLGVLSKAIVKLYELNGEERKLLATELTSSGENIESIGNFNLYLEKLEDENFYLYEVSGGKDYDVDDNGIIDNIPTPNKGMFHLLVKGSHIKAIKQANVTIVSELIYQKLLSSLSLEKSKIEIKMKAVAKEIIREDINSDGFVGIEDILKYNPILDKTKLQPEYQNKISKIIDDILNNKPYDLIAPIFTDKRVNFSINENLSLIQKVKIVDKSTLNITLLGEDANKFIYNKTTQELSLINKADFENPQDKNRDNLFKLTLEATDSYFNSTKKKFLIEILDVDETIPKVPILRDTNLSIYENNATNSLIGTVSIKNQGSEQINTFNLLGEESQAFTIDNNGKIFSSEVFDYEKKNNYTFQVKAINNVGESNLVDIIIQVMDIPDIKPSVQDISFSVLENLAIGTIIGKIYIIDKGDSNISNIQITGYRNNDFQVHINENIKVVTYLDYESYNLYYLQYSAINKAGESKKANLTIRVNNIFENYGSDYPKTESGIQTALDNADYSFVLNQLLNNRDAYNGLDDDTVNMNIAGAYVGSSGYTIFDITGAMSDGNGSSFNDFVNDITQDNDAIESINNLSEADTYYSHIVQGRDCNNTENLTQIQKDSCYNLGLVRLTSLTNSVKLLFGGESSTVQKWADGVDVNSSDDLNGNAVLDNSDASACAIVYANNPNDNCKDGTIYAYRGGVKFNDTSKEYNLTLIEVDVGSVVNGYQNFYQLISSNSNNNTPILTSGICDTNFNFTTTHAIDGVDYFPCPARDKSGEIMGIKEQIEGVANIQSLFPDGDQTKTTVESYLQNITGSTNGTIGLDNLSTYLRTH